MNFIQSFITDYFKPVAPQEVKLPSGDVAWSESSIYSGKDFEKYNPDDLVGKKGFGIYRRMMTDEQVKAVVLFKRDAITSRDYYFEADDELSEAEAALRIKVCERILSDMDGSFLDSMNGIMTANYQGFSMTEKNFSQIEVDKKTYWGLKSLRLKPFDTFTFTTDAFGNIINAIQKMNGKEQPINMKKFIHYVNNPEYDEHYGSSELREAYRPWFSKDKNIMFYNMWLEKHASGYKWITPKEGHTITAGTKEYNDIVKILNSNALGNGMLLPGNTEFHIQFPQAKVAYGEAIDMWDIHISRALLVPNLLGITPSGQTGSYSQSTNQLEAFLWTLDAHAARLEETINEQLFKELGALNFGDDLWPRFRFKPVSESTKMLIINTWKDLIQSGAVQPSDTDEAHLRDLLDMPERMEDVTDTSSAVKQANALNGAQVTALVDIVSRVSLGEISKESALEITVSAFPINRKQAELMLRHLGTGANTGGSQDDNGNLPDVKPKDNPDDNPASDGAGPNGSGDGDAGNNIPAPEGKQKPTPETVTGRTRATVSAGAYARAQARVDFSVIARNSETLEDEHTNTIATFTTKIISEAIIQAKQKGTVTEYAESNIKLTADTKTKAKLNSSLNKMLQEGWALGLKHAQVEIDKAKGLSFSKTADKQRVLFIAEDFFKIKAFKITGNFTQEALSKIEQTILNGAKYDKTWDQIETDIYMRFASDGLLSIEDAKAALGEALGNIKNPDARIRTIVRTGTFEAINEARYAYFSDPSLDGFVEAQEYSSILDSRTTQICQHLDGTTHSLDFWGTEGAQYRPPNHFNCRSLLIPVTQVDVWTEDEAPTMLPQKGFD